VQAPSIETAANPPRNLLLLIHGVEAGQCVHVYSLRKQIGRPRGAERRSASTLLAKWRELTITPCRRKLGAFGPRDTDECVRPYTNSNLI